MNRAKRVRKPTKAEQVRDYFLARPLVWIDGLELSRIGGAYAWRSRVSDCRRLYSMTIENRQDWVELTEGRGYAASEYRFVPRAPVVADATGDSTEWRLRL